MIEIEIYCYISGFLKWNISKKTSYIVGNKKLSGKIWILNLRNKRKSIFAKVINETKGERCSQGKRAMLEFFIPLIDGATKDKRAQSNDLNLSENLLFEQLSTIDFYILPKSITSHNKKSLQKLWYTQQKRFSFLKRDCNLPIFTGNETITKTTQYELSQEESYLLKASLYFSIKPDNIRKPEIITTFKKIHRLLLNNFKSEETKRQIKVHLSYLAYSYFYNYKLSPHILRQHRVLRSHRKYKDIIITKPDKGNGAVILDRKLYNNAI